MWSIHFSANNFTFLNTYMATLWFQDSLMILFNKIQNSPTTNITVNVVMIKSMKIKLVQVATTSAVVFGFLMFISGLAMLENCIFENFCKKWWKFKQCCQFNQKIQISQIFQFRGVHVCNAPWFSFSKYRLRSVAKKLPKLATLF